MIDCKYPVVATLLLAAILERGGRTNAELAGICRVTEKHSRKVLRELSKLGHVGWVRHVDVYRWHLHAEAEAIRAEVRAESRRARLERNRLYLIDYRARKKGGAEVSLEVTQRLCKADGRMSVTAPNSVFALGAQ